MILTSIHEIDSDGQVARTPVYSQVRIGDRCWLGARAMIMPGVTIGEGTIIGAGAVMTKDCEPGAVYVGVPARYRAGTPLANVLDKTLGYVPSAPQ